MRIDGWKMALAPLVAIVLFAICLKVSNSAVSDAVSALALGAVAAWFFIRWKQDRKRDSQADTVPWMSISIAIVSGVMVINSLSH